MFIEIKNFQFNPQYLELTIGTSITIKVLNNISSSQIYHDQRSFILSIINRDTDEEEIESPPLVQNQLFTFQFNKEGNYLIQCVNSIPFKCTIIVENEKQKNQLMETIKQPQIIKHVDYYAPEYRKLKTLGSDHQNNQMMASKSIVEQFKGKGVFEDQDIIDIMFNTANTSQTETTSTFNSSFNKVFKGMSLDTYSDTGKMQNFILLDRKCSDPIIYKNGQIQSTSVSNVNEQLINLRDTKQNIVEQIQQYILNQNSVQITSNTNNLSYKYEIALSILEFLEEEYLQECG